MWFEGLDLSKIPREDRRILLYVVNKPGRTRVQEDLGSCRGLRAAGVVKDCSTMDYLVVLEVLGVAFSNEYPKQLIIRFVVKNFREDVKRVIGLVPARVKLMWDEAAIAIRVRDKTSFTRYRGDLL